jgi:hypothetical protein
MVTPAFQAKVFGYADTLTAEGRTNTTKTQAFDAAQRTEDVALEGLADKALSIESDRFVNNMLNNARGPMTPDAMKLAVTNQARTENWDPKRTKAALSAVDRIDPSFSTSNPDGISGAAALDDTGLIKKMINENRQALAFRSGGDSALSVFSRSVSGTLNTDNPGLALTTELKGMVNPDATDEEKTLFSESAGSIQDTYVELFNEFNVQSTNGIRVPGHVIAQLIKDNVQSDGIILSGDRLETNLKAVRTALEKMDTQGELALMQQGSAAIEEEALVYAQQEAALKRYSDLYDWAEDRNNPEVMAEAAAAIQELRAGMEGPAPRFGREDPVILDNQASTDAVDANGNPVVAAEVDPVRVSPSVENSIITDPNEQSYNATFGNALAKAAGVNKGLSPEIMNSVAVASDLGNTIDGYGEKLDRFGGGFFASTVEGIDALSRRAAVAAGGLFPETGNVAIKEIDAASAARASSREALRTEGFFTDETAVAPKGPAVPVSPELSDAVNEYADMAAIANIDLSQNTRVRKALEVLASGRDPGGNPLSDVQKEVATQRLVEALESSGTKFVSRKEKDAMIAKLLSAAKVSRK